MVISLASIVYQYVNIMKTDDVSAVTVGIPSPGHAWSSMECSGDSLCIDPAGNKLGVGTNTPSQKLEVNGNIKLGGASPSYTVSNVIAPVNTSDVATKAYVDAAGGTQTYSLCYVQYGGSACASGFTSLAHYTTTSGWVADNAMGTTSGAGYAFGLGGSSLVTTLCRFYGQLTTNGGGLPLCWDSMPGVTCSQYISYGGGNAAVQLNGGWVIGPKCDNATFFAVCCK